MDRWMSVGQQRKIGKNIRNIWSIDAAFTPHNRKMWIRTYLVLQYRMPSYWRSEQVMPRPLYHYYLNWQPKYFSLFLKIKFKEFRHVKLKRNNSDFYLFLDHQLK